MDFLKRLNKWVWSPIGHMFRVRTLWQILAGGGVITAAGGMLEWTRSHVDILSLILLFLVSVAILALASRFPKADESRSIQPTFVPGEHPLTIISARWGIGGDAYKDVTDVVRAHAQPSSINLPASRGLFGDPYPNTTKHLIVEYSFVRQFWVDIKEDQSLILPEKYGEEQSRASLESAKAWIAERTYGASDPRKTRLEQLQFSELESEFAALPWARKIALKMIYRQPTLHEMNLRQYLINLGFGADVLETIVNPLRGTRFVEVTDLGIISPHSSRSPMVEELLNRWDANQL